MNFVSTAIADIPLVRRAMNGVSAKWPMIAVRFKISGNKTDDFKKKFKRDSDQCLTAVIAEWLQCGDGCFWRNVVCTMAARVGGDNPFEAEKVAREYQSVSNCFF
jgi:hypothetical protein